MTYEQNHNIRLIVKYIIEKKKNLEVSTIKISRV